MAFEAGAFAVEDLIASGAAEAGAAEVGAGAAAAGAGAAAEGAAGSGAEFLASGAPVAAGAADTLGAAGTAAGATQAGTGVSVLNSTSPTTTLDPQTAEILGVSPNTTTGMLGGTTPSGAEASLTGPAASPADASLTPTQGALPEPAQAPPPTNESLNQFTTGPQSTTQPSTLDSVLKAGKSINPQTAALLGISGVQALSKPRIPEAARTLQGTAGPNAAAASATIQSGGTASPAWATQKASIDASIDQQIQEQSQSILQAAINAGQGADSMVVKQQIDKLKTQLETQRQALYAQAQQQNVNAALQTLGISDQALTGVANAQFTASEQGKQSAAQTAALALQLQALSKNAG